ncbi:MAG TPA: hypothetical protein VFX98_11375 [Longimicrobiaceae bacterium]|nr:hypothetical protein [Longimicrobiaceae bacterium]
MRRSELLLGLACALLLGACGGRDAEGEAAQEGVTMDSVVGQPVDAPPDTGFVPPPAEMPPELAAPDKGEIPVPRSTAPPPGPRQRAPANYEECMAQARQGESAEERRVMEDGCKLLPRRRS